MMKEKTRKAEEEMVNRSYTCPSSKYSRWDEQVKREPTMHEPIYILDREQFNLQRVLRFIAPAHAWDSLRQRLDGRFGRPQIADCRNTR